MNRALMSLVKGKNISPLPLLDVHVTRRNRQRLVYARANLPSQIVLRHQSLCFFTVPHCFLFTLPNIQSLL